MTAKKHRFNIIDALIIIAILLAASAAVYILFFRSTGPESSQVKLRYVLNCDWIRSEFTGNVRVGDKVFDPSGNVMGSVTAVQVSEASYAGSDKSDGTPVVTKGIDGYKVLTLTVDADGTHSGTSYFVNGNEIIVGKEAGICFPNLYIEAEFINVEAR